MESWITPRSSYSGYIRVALVGAGAAASAVLLARAWKHAYPPRISLEAEILDCIASPKLFTLQELRAATGNFSESNLLSDSKLGRVYKGKLPTGAVVAVKVLPSGPGSAADFRREVAVIGCIRHRNIIPLQGFCMEDSTCVLVYPSLPGSDLKTCLFGENAGEDFPWPERFKVALQIARALVHLHHESANPVCHRNLNLSNVLVTEKKNVKLCNFGLACYQDKGGANGSAAGLASVGESGTVSVNSSHGSNFNSVSQQSSNHSSNGSLSFVMEGPVVVEKRGEESEEQQTAKDDVYSFGIILLQLVTGRKASFDIDGKPCHIFEWVWKGMENWEDWGTIIDPRLKAFDHNQVEVSVVLGLHCCQNKTRARPNMAGVYQMMNGDTPVPPIPSRPKEDTFVFPSQLSQLNGSSSISFDCWTPVGSVEREEKPFKMPCTRNNLFKGREADLRKIREAFETALVQAPCLSIYGLGGVGKTQLAIEYAYRSKDLYDGVLWVEPSDDVGANYASLARVLKLKIPSSMNKAARIEAVRTELEGKRKYLLILDNVSESLIEVLRPKVGASNVLVTTRIHLVYVIPLRLDSMSLNDAMEILKGMGGRGEWTKQTEVLEDIAMELGLLPLALAAAGQLLSNGHDPQRLLQKIRQDVGKCIERAPADLTFRKSSSLSELFEASLEQLNGDSFPDGDLARAIFFVGGFFSHEAIPLPLLTIAAQYFLGKEPDSEEDGEMAVMNLVRLSLAVRDDEGDVVFNRVLQAYAVSKTDHQAARSALLKAFLRAKCLRKAAPHLQHLWEAYKELLTRGECPQEEEKLVGVLAQNLAEYYVTFQSNRTRECFECIDAILDLLGPERAGKPYFEIVVAKLFYATRKKGDMDTARELMRTALRASEGLEEVSLARQVLRIYDLQLNWRRGDKEQEEELQTLANEMINIGQRLEQIPTPPWAGAWGLYYHKGRDFGTATSGLELLGWMFTTHLPDHHLALALYMAADRLLSGQVLPWGSGFVASLYARLEREAHICRLINLAFALPCGASTRAIQDKMATIGSAPAYGDGRERAEKKELLRRHVEKTMEWIKAGLGTVRSTLVLAVELGELGLVTGGQDGKGLIKKATALLEKELPAIEKSCGADSVEVSTTLFRLASLHRYMGPPHGLRRSRQIMESRMRVEEAQHLKHRETRFHFLLAQVYFEQGLLNVAQAQLHMALKLSQDSDRWRMGKVLQLLAAVSWLQGDTAAAAAHIRAAEGLGTATPRASSNNVDLDSMKRTILQWEENQPQQ